MTHNIFIFLLYPSIFVVVTCNDARHLVYPPGFGNKVQFIVGIGVPASNLPTLQSVTWGYVIKTNYVLPTNITEYGGDSLRYMKRSAAISRWDFYRAIADAIDRPSSTGDYESDYFDAEMYGRNSNVHCGSLFSGCSLSLIELFSKIQEEPLMAPYFFINVANNIKFLELVGALKHMKRRGWVLRDVSDPECIAAHMYRMAVMTFFIESSSTINRLRCLELSIIHDLAECIVGDITPVCGVPVDEKHRRESVAMKEIIDLMPTNKEYVQQLYEEYESQSTPEAKLVKEFDRLDMVLQAYEYEKQEGIQSTGRLEEFFQSTEGKFSSPFIKSIVGELKMRRNNPAGDNNIA